MSPAGPAPRPASGVHRAACPRQEELSALLDRELAPERIPVLESHVGQCEHCAALFRRLTAADYVLGLVLPGVNLTQQALTVKPDPNDAAAAGLLETLEAVGRAERLRAVRAEKLLRARIRRRRLIALAVTVALLVGAALAARQPGAVRELSGGARRANGAVLGPGQAGLCRGVRVRLGEGARAEFRCLFRWEQPRAELLAGRLEVLAGTLTVRAGGRSSRVPADRWVELGTDGSLKTGGPEPPPPAEGAGGG